MIGQFVESLEQKLLSASPTDDAADQDPQEHTVGDDNSDDEASTEDNSGPRKIDMPEPEPVDLLDTAGAPLLKRFGPFAIVALLLVLLRRRKR